MRNREIRERIALLEFENQELAKKLKEIEKHIGMRTKPAFPHCVLTYQNGRQVGYDALRERYRRHTASFNDGLS